MSNIRYRRKDRVLLLPGPNFLPFMKLQFFFFLVLLKLFLASSPDETSVTPNDKVFSYFSGLLNKINRNPSLSLTSYDFYIYDFHKIKGLHKRFPLDCMLSVRILDDIQLVYLTCLALKRFSYINFMEDLKQNLFRMNQKLHFNAIARSIFECFNWRILTNLRKNFTFADFEDRKVEWNERKMVVCVILSILQQFSFSTESFLEIKLEYERKISPRTYIRIISNLIEDIEMDFEAGAYKTFLRLQHFSKSYDGKIPTQEPFQQKIFTLVNLFHFYSHHIITFSPASLKLEICTPKFLALLVMSSNCVRSWEEIFAFFISITLFRMQRVSCIGTKFLPSS